MTLPIPWTTSSPVGSQWRQSFTITGIDISTFTFELVLRTSTSDTSTTPAAKISSTASTSSGYITVTPTTPTGGTVLAVLSSAATAALAPGNVYALALWSDPGLPDQTTWVQGLFTASPVAAP